MKEYIKPVTEFSAAEATVMICLSAPVEDGTTTNPLGKKNDEWDVLNGEEW